MSKAKEILGYVLGSNYSHIEAERVTDMEFFVPEGVERDIRSATAIVSAHENFLEFKGYSFDEFLNNLETLLENSLISKAFARGFLDFNSIFEKEKGIFHILFRESPLILQVFRNVGVAFEMDDFIHFYGPNVFDLLSKLWEGATVGKRDNYQDLITEIEGITTLELPVLKVSLRMNGAVLPSKKRPSDIGWDVTIIGIYKAFSSGTILYETGISVQPPNGWYVEIVPRSMFSSTGWVMPISKGIIDKGYTGTLKIPALRVSNNATGEMIEFENQSIFSLPIGYNGFQIILMPHIHTVIKVVRPEKLVVTERSEKGFGSRNMNE